MRVFFQVYHFWYYTIPDTSYGKQYRVHSGMPPVSAEQQFIWEPLYYFIWIEGMSYKTGRETNSPSVSAYNSTTLLWLTRLDKAVILNSQAAWPMLYYKGASFQKGSCVGVCQNNRNKKKTLGIFKTDTLISMEAFLDFISMWADWDSWKFTLY